MNTETEVQAGCGEQTAGNQPIRDESIARLVDCFYAKVRKDPEIGPIFNSAIQNWDAHLELLRDFWSTVLLGSARYKGNPLVAHFPLEVGEVHFRRWLALFSETAREILLPDEAAFVTGKAEKIAANIKRMIELRDQHRDQQYPATVENRREL
jgi:hemoglobin